MLICSGNCGNLTKCCFLWRIGERGRTRPVGWWKISSRDFGPVEGIYQLLRAARNPYVLVTAIDLQCLTALALQTLAGQIRPGVCCLVPCRDAWLEPLCSIYHKDALPVLEQMRSAGVRRPRALFDCVPTRYIEFADLGWNDSMVKNVNTRGEYEALLREEDSKETKKSCCTVKKEIDRI